MKKQARPNRRHMSRALALQALYAWKVSAENILKIKTELLVADSPYFDDEERISPSLCDQAYFNELTKNIPEQIDNIEEILAKHCDRKLTEITPIERVIFWVGTYELTERPEIPFKVVLNEAVELAKEFGVTEGHRYINGVLDKVAHSVREPALL
jgi:N utilization substance protein B